MKKGTKIALGVVGGLVVLGGITRLATGNTGNTENVTDTTAITAAETTTTASTTTTPTTTTVSTTTKITTTEKPLTVYLLNPDSMKIHYENCSTIEHPENFIKTIDYQKALEDGYEPCGRCNPINMNDYNR